MDYLEITGERKLSGQVDVSGAKNAALPILAASIIAKNAVNIENMPNVADTRTFLKLIKLLGGEFSLEGNSCSVDTRGLSGSTATYEIVKTMRASILALGPLLGRFGECRVSLPGGCAIGQRPVDLHLKALEKMGAEIEIKEGYIHAKAPGGLRGCAIVFDKITVTGTENIAMAAAMASGKTRIINAAKEPEVAQLCEMIRSAGIKIAGIGSNEIEIEGAGGDLLDFEPIRVIPDRVEAGTYLCAAAIVNSPLTLKNADPRHLAAVTDKLGEMGFGFDFGESAIAIKPADRIRAAQIVTSEYPGFPTDMQAQFMALSTRAEGVSAIEERLFENRFMHAGELARMGAKITLRGNIATISGGAKLLGADVMATDLRASSALVLAALSASGVSRIHRIYHLDRGYENLDAKLKSIGAEIARLKEP